MDKELQILDVIGEKNNLSQREISKETGFSLGTVNILLDKMIKEGLLKIEQIPANRVLYILTPKGASEKVVKTINYLKIHYKRINMLKEVIYKQLEKELQYGKIFYVLIQDNPYSDILRLAIQDIDNELIRKMGEIDLELTDKVFYFNNEKISCQRSNYINLYDEIIKKDE